MARNLVHRKAGVKASPGRQPARIPKMPQPAGKGSGGAARKYTPPSNKNGQARHK